MRAVTEVAQSRAAFLHGGQRMHPGEERYVVSMFVDMRGSTQMAADQLPFDTVFIVNRFLGAVSKAVTEGGGKVNQFLGDGLLALFGVDTDARTACRAALRAAAMIAANVEHLNRELAEAARSPVRFGIGINGGDVIVGDIGYGENVAYTALGDAVNVAARLEALAEPAGICISRVVRDQIRDKLPYVFEDLGDQQFKNIARPVRVYAMSPAAIAAR